MGLGNLYSYFLGEGVLSALHLVLALAVSYVLYYIGRAIYNVYFHPLSKFPGPALRAISSLPFLLEILSGTAELALPALHEKYGGVVRIRPDTLSFISSQAQKDIYGYRPEKPMQRDKELYFGRGDGVPDIITANDTDHARIRRLLAYAFSEQALRDQESLIGGYVDLLIKKLREKAKEAPATPVDLVHWYTFTTFDIVGDLAYGESFHALEHARYDQWMANVFQGVKVSRLIRICRAYPWLGTAALSLLKLFPFVMKAHDEHNAFTDRRVDQRLAMETDRKDFMSYILRHNDKKGMTKPEIYNTSSVLNVAGSETTATLLSGLTYYLLTNPSILHTLSTEIRSTFQAESDITFARVGRLPYLRAVIEEGLRIYPPVPFSATKRTGNEGNIIDGQYIPPHTAVAVNQWVAHRSLKNFRDPTSFVPERWLDDARYANDNRAACQPFSLGPRNCIGKNLAYAEVRTILARMIWNFEMELCEESRGWAEQKIYFLWDKPSLKVVLKPRVGFEG